MKISRSDWQRYIEQLGRINGKASALMEEWVNRNPSASREQIADMAYALATKYGEASAALACDMYDEIAAAQGARVPPAEPAATATYGETAKAINGTLKNGQSTVPATTGRLVKQAGADTMLQNAARDGAEFAWVPMGDTCAFCLTLASRGWQRQSRKARNRHASHIHANCDCEYCVRFDSRSTVEGYDPDALLEQYYAAEGNTPQEKINAMRRAHYAENAPTIRAQQRAAYAARREREKGLLYGGGHGTMQIAEPVKRITAIAASSVTEKVQSGDYSLRLTDQSYNKHVEGHRDYERYAASRAAKGQNPPSILTISKEEAQRIINEQSGTGIIKTRRDGTAMNLEMITCDQIIGKYYSRGEWHETRKATIHHGKGGSHIVPHAGGSYD